MTNASAFIEFASAIRSRRRASCRSLRSVSPLSMYRTCRCCRIVAEPALGLDGCRAGAGNLAPFLSSLAWLVRLRLLPSLSPLAALDVSHHQLVAEWGEHRGGMFVAVQGHRSQIGEQIVRSWHLLAEGDDGPLIPSMAAAAIIRRCLAGRPPAAGARVGAGELELDDYAPCSRAGGSATGCRQSVAGR